MKEKFTIQVAAATIAASLINANAAEIPAAAAPAGIAGGAVSRAMDSAAQQGRLSAGDAAERGVSRRDGASGAISYDVSPDDVHFSFRPPATTRRDGHPEDPEISLTDAELRTLDEIGENLVDFVDSEARIDHNRSVHADEMRDAREKDAKESETALVSAVEAREAAQVALVESKEELKKATDERDASDRDYKAAEERVQRINDRLKKEYKQIGDKNRAIAEVEGDIKKAIDEDDEAGALVSRAEDEKARADSVLASAEADKADAERTKVAAAAAAEEAAKVAAAAAKAKEEVRKAGEEAVAAATKAREESVAAAAKARDEAKAAAVKARGEADAAGKVSAAKARALAAARKDAEVAALAAERTAARAEAAAARVKALTPGEDETPGFFGRWRLSRATRAAAAAAKAAEAAKEASAKAEAAEKAFAGLRGSVEALAKAKKDGAAAEDSAVAKARQDDSKAAAAARDAEGKAATAAKDKRAADKAAVRAAGAVETAAAKAKAAAAEQALAANRAAAAKAALEEKESLKARIEGETDAENIANIMTEKELGAAEAGLSDARDAFDRAQERLNVIDRSDIVDRQRVYDDAQREVLRARDADGKTRRLLASVEGDALVEAMKDEKALELENKDRYDSFWNDFAADRVGKSAVGPDKAVDEAKKALDSATAASENAVAAETAAAAAFRDAQDALKAARDKAKAVAKEAGAAASAAAAAEKDLAKAEAVAVKEGEDPAARDEAVAKAKDALEARKADASAAEKAFAAAQDAVRSAEAAAGDARGRLDAAGDARKAAAADLKAAGRVVAQAERQAGAASADVRRAVAVLKRAFDDQVAEAQRRKRAAIAGLSMSEAQKARAAAREARRAFKEARAAYDKARSVLDGYRREFAKEKSSVQWDTPLFVAARQDFAAARRAFEAAEERYNEFYSDNTYATADMTMAEADERLAAQDVRRVFPKDGEWSFRGDRRWLARTSVNGESLLESFVGEMEWQAGLLRDEGKAVADEIDPSRVLLTHEQAAECAAKACEYVRRRAVYGGFYFAGLEVRPDERTVFVDKGRFGPIDVVFRDKDENRIDEADTRMFTSTNILAKLGAADPRAAGVATNDASGLSPEDLARLDAWDKANPNHEGAAFNFIAFRKRFYDLNANPDVKKADVKFSLLPPTYDYGYAGEDSSDDMAVAKNNRAIGTAVTVQEAPWPAPVHGTVGIDNYNGMGDVDKPFTAESLMARATVQTLDLWGRGHALTLSGNGSLDSSAQIYGGAASYYVPRDDEQTWFDGSWRRLSGWSWTFHGGYSWVRQKNVIPRLDVEGTGYYGGLVATSRLVDFGESTLDLSLGLTYRYVENSLIVDHNKGQKFNLGKNEKGYEILPLSVALLYAEKGLDVWNGRNYASFELSYNLGGSDDSELKAYRVAIDDANYFIARLQLARLQLINQDSDSFVLPRMLFLRADAQYAPDPVIGAEQYGLGGHGTVRGYVEREIMADSGASGTVEFRTPIGLGLFGASAEDPMRASDRLQLVYFLDFGWYSLEDADGGSQDDFIYSVGAGLRYSWDDLVVRFDWGVPLNTNLEDFDTSKSGVGHASVQYQF